MSCKDLRAYALTVQSLMCMSVPHLGHVLLDGAARRAVVIEACYGTGTMVFECEGISFTVETNMGAWREEARAGLYPSSFMRSGRIPGIVEAVGAK
eukprot:1137222-Pelagomonas_calceolata.AAC.12